MKAKLQTHVKRVSKTFLNLKKKIETIDLNR